MSGVKQYPKIKKQYCSPAAEEVRALETPSRPFGHDRFSARQNEPGSCAHFRPDSRVQNGGERGVIQKTTAQTHTHTHTHTLARSETPHGPTNLGSPPAT